MDCSLWTRVLLLNCYKYKYILQGHMIGRYYCDCAWLAPAAAKRQGSRPVRYFKVGK